MGLVRKTSLCIIFFSGDGQHHQKIKEKAKVCWSSALKKAIVICKRINFLKWKMFCSSFQSVSWVEHSSKWPNIDGKSERNWIWQSVALQQDDSRNSKRHHRIISHVVSSELKNVPVDSIAEWLKIQPGIISDTKLKTFITPTR